MVVRRIPLLAGLVACVCAANWAVAAELMLQVVQLRHRTVEQVLPVVQPLVPKPGTASGMHNSLVVRTTAENFAEIRRVLDAIDRQPRRLLITVRQDADMDRWDDRARARVYSTQALENDRNTQRVQVLEGNEAFIRVGQSVPVPTRSIVRNAIGGRVVESSVETLEYRDVLSGFHVRPRLAGEVVTVDVSPQRDTPGNQGRGSVNVQQLSTTVSGRLGAWIEIGGMVSGRSLEESGTVYRTNTATGDNRRVLLKVDEIP